MSTQLEISSCSLKLFKNEGISPPGTMCTRIAFVSSDQVVAATRNKLFSVQVGDIPTGIATVKAKQTGIPLPVIHQNFAETSLTEISLSHCSDIQSVVAMDRPGSSGVVTVASSDATGTVCVSTMEKSSAVPKPKLLHSFAKKSSANVGEFGWTGLALHPTSAAQIAVANFFDRSVTLWDGETVVRELCSQQWPTQICYIPGTELLAVTEYNQLAIYDMKAKVPCVKRLKTGSGSLYAMSAVESGVICGGADRAVHVYDTKKWAARGHWSNALKYEISSVFFAAKDDKLCYVGGVDSELLCGNWSGKGATVNHYDGYRGDSRWLGLAKYTESGSDTLAGISERGTFTLFRNGIELYPHLHSDGTSSSAKKRAGDGTEEGDNATSGGKRPKFFPPNDD